MEGDGAGKGVAAAEVLVAVEVKAAGALGVTPPPLAATLPDPSYDFSGDGESRPSPPSAPSRPLTWKTMMTIIITA